MDKESKGYFFVITKKGLDRNGNTKYKIQGFAGHVEYFPMDKEEMKDVIGKWNINGRITTCTKEQILENLRGHFTDFRYVYT